MKNAQSVLVLGKTGRFGRNVAKAFEKAGWRVHGFNRATNDLMTAAAGMDVIVNGWNPPYDQWEKQVPVLTDQIIRAAKASGATVIIPGNVYVFGKDAPQNFSADTPHHARNPLGRVRINMEEAFRRSGVQTIILRAGDFLDIQASGNWFDLVLTKKIDKGIFTYPAPLNQPHAWAYLPDLARVAVELAEMRADLGRFEDIPFAGYTLTGQQLHQLVEQASGRGIRVKRMRWLPLYLAAPFWRMGRHLLEMKYLWSKPHRLDGTRLKALLPDIQVTSPQDAVRAALAVQ
ncbi:MAG TPA: epimerase [Aliiroseovarius sp.]|nr:epimerase [Aliiroseovarius sp.]